MQIPGERWIVWVHPPRPAWSDGIGLGHAFWQQRMCRLQRMPAVLNAQIQKVHVECVLVLNEPPDALIEGVNWTIC
jgi:hypothetical protein